MMGHFDLLQLSFEEAQSVMVASPPLELHQGDPISNYQIPPRLHPKHHWKDDRHEQRLEECSRQMFDAFLLFRVALLVLLALLPRALFRA
jgi:hypothetical protein